MRVLILGSGGREHAFAWKIAQSPRCDALFIAPGNAGTATVGTNVSLSPTDFEAIHQFVDAEKIDMMVVGPEQPLAEGIVDYFSQHPVKVIGPNKQAAQLEASKAFAKAFMQKHGVPTAGSASFEAGQLEEALEYVESHSLPVVIKASGLAAGKGVLICESHEEAIEATRSMLSGSAFGDSGKTIVVEEFLKGVEFSLFVLTDGDSYKIFPTAMDYKRIGEQDTGLNTGGMGAVAPFPVSAYLNPSHIAHITERTLAGLKAEGIVYKGIIFIGLMVTGKDSPYVLEYNVRMGDPETQVVLPLIENDLLDLFEGVANDTLAECEEVRIKDSACSTVILVSGGYPVKYEKGKRITGIEAVEGSIVFHAGTKRVGEDILTNGGRVIAITSFGESLVSAAQQSLKNAEKIAFEGKYYRTDIGARFQ